MNILIIGPTDKVLAFFNQPQADQHVKDFRWHKFAPEQASLHVLDYRLHLATKELRRGQFHP